MTGRHHSAARLVAVPLLVALAAACARGSVRIPKYSFAGFIGSSGDKPGEFRRPTGLAVGPTGDLYVADSGNRRIQVLSPAGEFLRQWGARGEAAGQFENPVDVAVGPAGSVYVADYDQDRIQRFTQDGVLVIAWGQSGSEDGEFNGASGIELGPEGRVYVADFYNHRIQVFGPEGRHLATLGRMGHGDGQLYYPTDVTLGSGGELLVADAYNHRIHALAADGATLFKWGGRWMTALGFGPFKVPTGLALDYQGRVHVADSGRKRAVLLDKVGNVLSEWRLQEDVNPEVYSPTRVAAGPDRVYFVDTSNDRIAVLELR